MPYLIRDGADDEQTMASAGNGQSATGIIPTYECYGTTGTDRSVNPAPIPVTAALLTIPVNLDRAKVWIQNQSQGTIQIVRSNGTGGQRTSIFLTALSVWESMTFKGQIDVYAPGTAQVSAYED